MNSQPSPRNKGSRLPMFIVVTLALLSIGYLIHTFVPGESYAQKLRTVLGMKDAPKVDRQTRALSLYEMIRPGMIWRGFEREFPPMFSAQTVNQLTSLEYRFSDPEVKNESIIIWLDRYATIKSCSYLIDGKVVLSRG